MKKILYIGLGIALTLSGSIYAMTTGRNGSNIEEYVCSVSNALCVYLTNNGPAYDTSKGALAVTLSSTPTRITTAASTLIFAGPGAVKHYNVVASTAGTIAVFNDATSPCDTNQITGAIPLVAGDAKALPVELSLGICILSTGVLDVTVVTEP